MLLVLGVAAVLLVRRHRAERAAREAAEERAAADRSARPSILPDDPVWGAADARVTVVVFGDLQCPFLARVWPVLTRAMSFYGPNELRIVWKDRPAFFHPRGRGAALAGRDVFEQRGNDAFWAFVRHALTHQSELVQSSGSVRGKQKLADNRALVRKLWASEEEPPLIYVDGALPRELVQGGFSPSSYQDWVALIDGQLKRSPGRARVDASLEAQGGTRAPYRPEWRRVPVDNSPSLGPATARATVVEFCDFESDGCRHLQASLRALRAKFGDQVRLVWKHRAFAFQPEARRAALLASHVFRMRGNDEFWRTHDALFAGARLDGPLDDDSLVTRDHTLSLQVEAGSRSDTSSYPREGSVDGELTPLVTVNGLRVMLDDDDPQTLERAVAEARPEADPPPTATATATATASKPMMWIDGVRVAGDRTSSISEGVDPVPRRQIEQSLNEQREALRECNAGTVKLGRVLVEIVTSSEGKVQLAQDGGSSVPDPAIVECVIGVLRGLTFPRISATTNATESIAFVVVLRFDAH